MKSLTRFGTPLTPDIAKISLSDSGQIPYFFQVIDSTAEADGKVDRRAAVCCR
jgi:precorrin-3B methylase